MKVVDIIAAVLVIVGALNWGLWGAFEFDLVAALLGGGTAIPAKIVYVLVGIAGLFLAVRMATGQKRLSHAMA